MVTMQDINEFCGRVGETFRPRRIILFGSYARGEARPDSDVDLLVEVDQRDSGCGAAASIIRKLEPKFGVDLIVRSKGDMELRLRQNDSFLAGVVRDGRVVYESSD